MAVSCSWIGIAPVRVPAARSMPAAVSQPTGVDGGRAPSPRRFVRPILGSRRPRCRRSGGGRRPPTALPRLASLPPPRRRRGRRERSRPRFPPRGLCGGGAREHDHGQGDRARERNEQGDPSPHRSRVHANDGRRGTRPHGARVEFESSAHPVQFGTSPRLHERPGGNWPNGLDHLVEGPHGPWLGRLA
jgi:hypothetical protein